jgi:hypothetical protein
VTISRKTFQRWSTSKSGSGAVCTFDVTVPEVVALPNEAAQRSINEALAALVPSEHDMADCDMTQDLSVSYDAKYNDAGLLSIVVSAGFNGGVHPDWEIRPVNVWTDSGAAIELFGDVLQAGSDAALAKLLAPDVHEAVEQAGGNDPDTERELARALEHPAFVLEKSGVRLLPLGIARYARVFEIDGFFLSYSDLAPILARGKVADRVLGSH